MHSLDCGSDELCLTSYEVLCQSSVLCTIYQLVYVHVELILIICRIQ